MVAEISRFVDLSDQQIEQLAAWTASKAERYLAQNQDVTDVRSVHISFASKAVAVNKVAAVSDSTDELEQLIYDVADLSMGQTLLTRVRELARRGACDVFVKGTDAVVVHFRDGSRESIKPWYTSLKALGDDIRSLRLALGTPCSPFDLHNPSFDARLPGGIRLNASHSLNSGYELSFRVPDHSLSSLNDLINNGTLQKPLASFLAAVVRARLNVIISGGTGAGKTALLQCMLGELNPLERVVTIEDQAELDLATLHPRLDVVELQSQRANSDGYGEVTSRQLMHTALRMHPDRIVVGEARDEIARELLTAMSSGNDGSVSTLHARASSSVVDRLVECSGLDYFRVVESVRNAVDLFIHIQHLSTGERRITDILQVSPAREHDGLLRLKPIFSITKDSATQSSHPQLVSQPTGRIASSLYQAGWKT